MAVRIGRIDLHIHTSFSDGTCSVDEAVVAARMRKMELFAITDHYSEFKQLPRRMGKGQLKDYLNEFDGIKAVKGLEADILSDGISISESTASLFDLILGGLHILQNRAFWYDSRPISDPVALVEEIRVTLIKAFESKILDVLAHPTWLPEDIRHRTGRLISRNWIQSVVEAASDHNVAIEVSSAWKVPDDDFVEECLKRGVKLAVGSDAHNASMIGEISYARELLSRLNASSESVFFPIYGCP